MVYNFNEVNNFLSRLNDLKIVYNKGIEYYNVASSFDIEASSFYIDNQKNAIMYVWQFAVDDDVIIGRTWEQFIELNKRLQQKLRLNSKRIFTVYVHNLSYEFQFMRKWFKWVNIFATDERKPLYCQNNFGITFKCSYRLSGYSLATVAKNLTKHNIKKLTGDLDYSLIRHSKTYLSKEELQYCINDVLIVTAYINECLDEYKDIYNIPLTQTGKVRRYVRKICLKDKSYKYLMTRLTLTSMEYLQLRKAFQGGFTHANPMYSMQDCYNVTSFDFTSSYPAVMVSEKYPMSRGRYLGKVTLSQFEFYRKKYCCLFDIKITNIRSKYNFENIISLSKCFRYKDVVLNNGRIFSASEIYTTITDVDYECLIKFYDFDCIEIHNLYIYEKSYLPKDFIQSVLKLYGDKTELKNVEGKEIEYLHSKEMLNSCYGMCVTDLLNDVYLYENNIWGTEKTNIEYAIEKYNNDKNRFLFYPWGVWVTAYARRNLFTGILECNNDYIYADTDSIKIMNAEKHIEYIDKYNTKIECKLKSMCEFYGLDFNICSPKTKEDKTKILGVWDFDGRYKRFKTLGAKRYMCLDTDDNLSLTVSGVNKKIAIPYLLNKYKNNIDDVFNAFNDMLIVPKGYSGKKTLTYIDDERVGVIKDYQGNYYNYKELSSIHMEDAEYSLNIACDYLDFILKLNKREI